MELTEARESAAGVCVCVLTVALSVVVSRGPCEVTLFLRHVAIGPESRVGEEG